MRFPVPMVTVLLAGAWASAFIATGGTLCLAEAVVVDLPQLEDWYGGFVGVNYRQQTFCLGRRLQSVAGASLHVSGHSPLPVEIGLLGYLDGVAGSPEIRLPQQRQFDLWLPLPASPGTLDGRGTVALRLNVYTCCDLAVWVDSADLRLDAVPLPSGDFDADGDVDLSDFAHFQACFSGPNRPSAAGCGDADFDCDNDVDLADFQTFQVCFNGPNRPSPCT